MAAKKEEVENKTCFVIMPFSDPDGYEPGHFRKIYEHIFVPAITAAGYQPLRIDDNSVSNLIHSKMLNELINAPMALCDLSTNNPNVLYELGIRHAFDKPVVLVHEIGQERIFDIGGITSIEYHPARRYEDVLEDHRRIEEAICQTAQAKNKYSVMDLAAIQAARPASGESVSSEQRIEYLLEALTQKVNTLEKSISDSQYSRSWLTYASKLNSSKDDQGAYEKSAKRYADLLRRNLTSNLDNLSDENRKKLQDAYLIYLMNAEDRGTNQCKKTNLDQSDEEKDSA